MPLSVKAFFSNIQQLPWEEIPFSDWVQIVIGLLSLAATIVISFFIYWLQSRHEKEIEQLQTAQHKAELENKADQFLIENESERGYLPWCIFAAKLHRHEYHTRKIYTAFCKCPDELQIKILERAGFSTQGFDEKLHIHEWIEFLKADIETYQLGRDVLYDGAKYFHRGFLRYRDEAWGESGSKCCFEAINKTGYFARILREDGQVDIGDYIDEYFYYFLKAPEGTDIEKRPIPPIDYVWDTQDLGGGTEKNMCMWVMELITDICIVIHNSNIHKLSTEPAHRNYTGASPETFEDAYYAALQWLSYAYANFEI